MSFNIDIDNKSRCDECNKFVNDELIYCQDCYSQLFKENGELKNEIEELKDSIKYLKNI